MIIDAGANVGHLGTALERKGPARQRVAENLFRKPRLAKNVQARHLTGAGVKLYTTCCYICMCIRCKSRCTVLEEWTRSSKARMQACVLADEVNLH
jgi:hypothetical protein